ncbi:hypothetical protein [Crystallibacter degradans]|uniref:hypothetical protein n=1 Tax=Crystallibacter degradans TaxID=2726743 RepID=UPI0014747D55|nr:hypothetical protein [Arthrobacter sp. SF27]NMR30927.1 hypothetical protein [Arthrobacter sp. SF27]
MEWFIWVLIVVIVAALLWWLFTRGSSAGQVPASSGPLGHAPTNMAHGPSDAAAQAPTVGRMGVTEDDPKPRQGNVAHRSEPAAGGVAAGAATGGLIAGHTNETGLNDKGSEPIDGWTESAAETAHSEPAVEDKYIEDSDAPAPTHGKHAAPVEPDAPAGSFTGATGEQGKGRSASQASPGVPETEAEPKPQERGSTADSQDPLYDETQWPSHDGETVIEPRVDKVEDNDDDRGTNAT